MEFGDAVRARREALGMSLGALSDRCGVSRAMLSEIETGKKQPSLKSACAISVGLECQISDLLDVEGDTRFQVLDAERRRVLVDPQTGVERHLLAPPMVQRGVQVLLFVFPPGQTVDFGADGPGTIVHVTCLTGRLRVERFSQGEPESADLGSGESVNYGGEWSERLTNLLEGQETRALVVMDASRRGEPAVFE